MTSPASSFTPDYQRPPRQPSSARPAVATACTGLALTFLASILLAWFNFRTLWPVPPGSAIRPMALTALDLIIAGAALVVALLLALVTLLLGWRLKRAWLLAGFLSLAGFAPLCTSQATWSWIIAHHHLLLEE